MEFNVFTAFEFYAETRAWDKVNHIQNNFTQRHVPNNGNGNNIAKLLHFEFIKMMLEMCSILIQILQFALIFWFLKAQQIGPTDNFNGTERKRNIKSILLDIKKACRIPNS